MARTSGNQRLWLRGVGITALTATGVGAALIAGGGASKTAHRRPTPAAGSVQAIPMAARAPISREIGEEQRVYWGRPVGPRVASVNQVQGWKVGFARSSMSLGVRGGAQLRLRLASVGSVATVRPFQAASPSAQRNVVRFQGGAVSEWFANGPLGMEQGFTVARAPAVGSDLRLVQSMSGNLRPRASGNGTVSLGRPKQRRADLVYGALHAVDASGRTLPSSLSVNGHDLIISVNTAHAEYPLRVDPLISDAFLTGTDVPSDGSEFWDRVAMSADTIVVGDQSHLGGNGPGAAYVFSKPAGGWADATQTAELTPPGGQSPPGFGGDVAVDENTVVVADADADGNGGGAAYVYQEPSGGWQDTSTPTAVLTPPGDYQQFGAFGSAVTINGSTIAVAAFHAPFDNSTSTFGPGAVYVYHEPAGGWQDTNSPVAVLAPSNGVPGETFGADLASTSDTVVVGDPFAVINGTPSGAVYVFQDTSTGWGGPVTSAELSDSNLPADSILGFGVAISGNTVVAGAPGFAFESGGGPNTGEAAIYQEPAAGWQNTSTPTAVLTGPAGTVPSDAFGVGISIDGPDVTVSAPFQTVGGAQEAGVTYVYHEPSGGWQSTDTPDDTLTVSPENAGGLFGATTAMDGDMTVVPNQAPVGLCVFQSSTSGSDTCSTAPAPPAPPAINCGSADRAWHSDNVSIPCTATDSGGPGLANPAQQSFNLVTNVPAGSESANASTNSVQVCDTDGNCSTAGPITGIMVDRKPPSVSCGNADGSWHANNVSISCTASDAGSGLAQSGQASFTLSTSVAQGEETSLAATNSVQVCDAVGNCSTAGPAIANEVDRKPPTITINTPADRANYTVVGTLLNPVTVSYSCTDGGSGVASCVGTDPNGSRLRTGLGAVGLHTFTVTATDKVGNTSTLTYTYSVGLL